MPRKTPRAIAFHRRDLMKLGLGAALLPLALNPAAAEGAAKVIGFGQADRTANYYKGLIRGVEEQAEDYGYEIRQIFSGLNAQKQVAEINGWIASGVDGMVVLALDPSAMGPIVQKCKDKGILFISYAVYIEGSDGFLSFDDRAAGKALGQHLAGLLKARGADDAAVGFLTYSTAQVTVDRVQSVQEELRARLPGLRQFEAEAVNAPEGLKAVQSMLQAHPDMRIVIGCADDACLGARSAFVNAGITGDDIFIAGFDGAPQNLELLKAGDPYIRASMGLDIERLGRRSIEIAHTLWENPQAPKSETEIREPYLLLTHDTDAAEFERLLSAYG